MKEMAVESVPEPQMCKSPRQHTPSKRFIKVFSEVQMRQPSRSYARGQLLVEALSKCQVI
jgi:hypothetical protein